MHSRRAHLETREEEKYVPKQLINQKVKLNSKKDRRLQEEGGRK